MSTGKIEAICGKNSSGKTALALGRALQALTKQRTAIVIQFLKGNQKQESLEVVKRLEPELKIFRFEKSERYFAELTKAEKREEHINILNGLNYAKKVLSTGECDLVILDEALGLVDQGIIRAEELAAILECRGEADVILTGRVLPEPLKKCVHRVFQVDFD